MTLTRLSELLIEHILVRRPPFKEFFWDVEYIGLNINIDMKMIQLLSSSQHTIPLFCILNDKHINKATRKLFMKMLMLIYHHVY